MTTATESTRRGRRPLPPAFLSALLAFAAAVATAPSVSAGTFAALPRVDLRTISPASSSLPSSPSVASTAAVGKRRGAVAAAAAAPCLSLPRGGALDSDYDSDFDDDVDDFDDDDDLFFDGADVDDVIGEDDFGEDGTLERASAAWAKTPPFTKMYLSASVAATLWGYLLNKNEFPRVLLLDWKPILTRMQLWRPLTAFLNVGPFGLGYAMTGHFVWTYMSTLERLNHDRPYDFWIMILFGCVTMVAGYTFLNISPRFLGHNLSTFLVYVWSRYHEGMEVNMFELFVTRAETLPWFFLAQTFLLEGELPVLDLLGIFFGHIYHHCKTSGIIRAPRALVEWYEKSESSKAIRERYKSISSDFQMQ
eukprot:CAMPEP_0183294992 /NCGR_PEP_ID=MMETSP0160_2-20130417/3105_1 /TAXON_ID=2839 ORGANISM="Odontella Sinensis, Strain Grunow 1884" /NCGR_SAMPLE_ID=MMETSP0160_2 /ASSEMBLY_ACC=CAM_ASM_000250 /LENGTH=363 /DNA_ID=CAMNT_0025456391 /DNA_START=81 /DNA_END=1175 /DNA_ORIENTATION=+